MFVEILIAVFCTQSTAVRIGRASIDGQALLENYERSTVGRLAGIPEAEQEQQRWGND